MRKLLKTVLAIAFAGTFSAVIPTLASAQTVLQTPDATTIDGNQVYSGVAVEFIVNTAVFAKELGIFDSGIDGAIGANTTLSAYLFRSSDGAVMASETFTSGAPGILNGGYLFKDITDVALAPGTYVLAGYGWTSDDPLHNSNVGGAPDIFNDGGGLLTYVGTRWGGGGDPAGTFPLGNLNNPNNNNFFGAANMVFAIPEPEIYAMMLAGLGLMGFVARRRKQAAAA